MFVSMESLGLQGILGGVCAAPVPEPDPFVLPDLLPCARKGLLNTGQSFGSLECPQKSHRFTRFVVGHCWPPSERSVWFVEEGGHGLAVSARM